MRSLCADRGGVTEAARILRCGGLVCFPTETVYGLGVDAANAAAVARVYEVKGRPRFNPLIVHVADQETAERIGHFNELARRLASAFWPGPLTLVVPKCHDSSIVPLVTCSLDTVAVRVPGHPLALEFLQEVGSPVAAPSANPSGRISPTQARHVALTLSGVDVILDGGSARIGIESTVVEIRDDRAILLRSGGVSREEIDSKVGEVICMPEDSQRVVSPGQLSSHYAPRTAVRLDAEHVSPGEALLCFGSRDVVGASEAVYQLNLSFSGDVREAAANLFDFLHRLDGFGAQTIAVSPIPRLGLGEAINDRLARAAASRSGEGKD